VGSLRVIGRALRPVSSPAPGERDDEVPYEPLLGSVDVQLLADLDDSFGFVRGINVLPVTRGHVVRLAMLATLPIALLVFLVVPLAAILDYLA